MKDTHYFTIDTRKLISLSNSMFGVHEVSIYEWKNEKVSNKIPDIQMRNRCNTFTIYNTTYIACGREYRTQTVIVMRWFILLSQSYENLETTLALILICPFTDGMAPSLSITGPSRLMAPWVGIPSQQLATFSSSWLIVIKRVELGLI